MKRLNMTVFTALLYSAACAVLFGAWAALVFSSVKSPDAPAFISHIQITLALLTGHILTLLGQGSKQASPDATASPQAGFVRIGLLVVLVIVSAFALAGCAGFQQALTGYEASAVKGIQAAEDNNIRIWATDACGTPFSAAIRNPLVIPALKALCLPAGDASSPATLLNDIPVKPVPK